MGLFFSFDNHYVAKHSNDLPAGLPPGYILKGASVHCYQNEADILLSQTARTGYGITQLYFIQLHKKQSVYIQEREPMLGIWCMMQGSATWMLQGNGKTLFKEGQCKLVYSPGGLLHHSTLDKGIYAILGFSVPPQWLRPMAGKTYMIEYLLQQVEQEGGELIQQLPLELNGSSEDIYNQLLLADYAACEHEYTIQMCQKELLEIYLLSLRKEQRRLQINDGDVKRGILLKNYIDSNLSGDVSIKSLEMHFRQKSTTLQKALKCIMGQTLAPYPLERRMGRAFQEIVNTNDTLAVIARRCGMTEKNLLGNFKSRFGFNTRWLRARTGFWFPDHD